MSYSGEMAKRFIKASTPSKISEEELEGQIAVLIDRVIGDTRRSIVRSFSGLATQELTPKHFASIVTMAKIDHL